MEGFCDADFLLLLFLFPLFLSREKFNVDISWMVSGRLGRRGEGHEESLDRFETHSRVFLPRGSYPLIIHEAEFRARVRKESEREEGKETRRREREKKIEKP